MQYGRMSVIGIAHALACARVRGPHTATEMPGPIQHRLPPWASSSAGTDFLEGRFPPIRWAQTWRAAAQIISSGLQVFPRCPSVISAPVPSNSVGFSCQ